MHHCTKFRQNGQIIADDRDIVFNVFQNGGRPLSWILKIDFEHPVESEGPMCVSMQNLIQIGRTVAEI